MPFGCLALRDGRTYHSPTEITDKYEIGQVLKAKEFCELCLAKDRQTDKVYVCKKFFKKDGRKVRKAAKNEIMILKMVNHPNILQLIDAYETKREYYIIQELATGGDVFDWILDQGNYTERDASNVIRQVLEAVAYLHSLNIVHRNLKLENLMYYTENNHSKVVLRDFYLSKFENGSITEPCGTPEYLAPEVVARHRYGRPVDCWAVGVIMYILLSGNPPFFDETEEEKTDLHNRIIFCRIVAGDFEFDSPYWDDISPAAKELVCRLMEVDQMLRITAQDALWHEWIAGNGASEKNLKDGVCAQFEKNFAKAKWRKAIRVTTFMQRLRNSEMLTAHATTDDQTTGVLDDSPESEGPQTDLGSVPTVSVTVENTPVDDPEDEDKTENVEEKNTEEQTSRIGMIPVTPSVGISPSATAEPIAQQTPSTKTPSEEPDKVTRKGAGEGTRKIAASLGQDKVPGEVNKAPATPESTKVPESAGVKVSLQQDVPLSSTKEKKPASSPDTLNRRKMAANLSMDPGPEPAAKTKAVATDKDQTPRQEEKADSGKKQEMSPGSWCQTQVPEAVAEKSAVAEVGPRTRDQAVGRADEAMVHGTQVQSSYKIVGTSSLGRHKPMYSQELGARASGYASPYCSPYSVGRGSLYSTLDHRGTASADWQMDSVIEQIEKQMAAVLEKIEGDMPSLLEQISDCPETLPRAKSAQSSPSVHPRSYHHSTPPPLPTTPRPPLPNLPHLTIPPPSYPPPAPPSNVQAHTQPVTEQEDRDGQRGTARSGQSPHGGFSGRGL
ncbi:caM kinase-like vesicle-associated, like isoform X2 [Alosa sapidissima]|uniref:caM kinase-like vesicle-associated, like isoform X2 n=1 Tax=Alosa sapidissima TaxID=34773 RepID=UPI001C086F1B|nr:caM kinase-like vesicle-associated, like isoform X2 [Alosa sapidissima]